MSALFRLVGVILLSTTCVKAKTCVDLYEELKAELAEETLATCSSGQVDGCVYDQESNECRAKSCSEMSNVLELQFCEFGKLPGCLYSDVSASLSVADRKCIPGFEIPVQYFDPSQEQAINDCESAVLSTISHGKSGLELWSRTFTEIMTGSSLPDDWNLAQPFGIPTEHQGQDSAGMCFLHKSCRYDQDGWTLKVKCFVGNDLSSSEQYLKVDELRAVFEKDNDVLENLASKFDPDTCEFLYKDLRVNDRAIKQQPPSLADCTPPSKRGTMSASCANVKTAYRHGGCCDHTGDQVHISKIDLKDDQNNEDDARRLANKNQNSNLGQNVNNACIAELAKLRRKQVFV